MAASTESQEAAPDEGSGGLSDPHIVEISRTISAPPDQVWQLMTSPTGSAALLGDGAVLGGKGEPWRTSDGPHGVVRLPPPRTAPRLVARRRRRTGQPGRDGPAPLRRRHRDRRTARAGRRRLLGRPAPALVAGRGPPGCERRHVSALRAAQALGPLSPGTSPGSWPHPRRTPSATAPPGSWAGWPTPGCPSRRRARWRHPVVLDRAVLLDAIAEVDREAHAVFAGAGHGREAGLARGQALLRGDRAVGVGEAEVVAESRAVGDVEPGQRHRRIGPKVMTGREGQRAARSRARGRSRR